MSSELYYQLALTLVPNIGDVQAKILVEHFGAASAIFKAKTGDLEKLDGIGSVRARSIRHFEDFGVVEKEMAFIEKYGIRPLFITDAAYPKRLLNCYDSPTLLFYKGEADLNASRVVAVVGTRSLTDYGRGVTEKLVQDLKDQQVLVISGLAFGIDAVAHKAALKAGLTTVGIVGHGLDKVYPAEHAALAREMTKAGGGLLSEFFSGTRPDRHNFPLRNRIVAGISDATIVVETAVKGGSMITASLADAYNRDVFAVPGRTTDKISAGCNHLIKHNKAILLTDAAQLTEIMGWQPAGRKAAKKQKELFIEMTAEEKIVVGLLQESETLPIDEINLRSGLSSSAVAAAILNMELQNVIASLPGKMYKLLS